jgi:hypothetical protein
MSQGRHATLVKPAKNEREEPLSLMDRMTAVRRLLWRASLRSAAKVIVPLFAPTVADGNRCPHRFAKRVTEIGVAHLQPAKY